MSQASRSEEISDPDPETPLACCVLLGHLLFFSGLSYRISKIRLI